MPQSALFKQYPEYLDYSVVCLRNDLIPNPWHIIHILDRFDRTTPTVLTSWSIVMAKKRTFGDEFKFINCQLNSEQGVAFNEWYKAKNKPFEAGLDELMADSYKVAFSWDDKNQCFIASLVSKDSDSENSNKCLTARSDNWLEAMALLVYKHFVIFQGTAWQESAGGKAWG